MDIIRIEQIENGYLVNSGLQATFCLNKTDVIKKIAEIMNVEIGIEIKDKDRVQ